MQSEPQNSLVFSNIGLVYRMMQDFEAAALIYSKEIEYSSQPSSGHNKRAFCYAKLGRYTEAISDYSASIELEKNNCHAYHNRGICLQKLERFKEVNAALKCRRSGTSTE